MMLIKMEHYSHTQLLGSNYRTVATVPIGYHAPDGAWYPYGHIYRHIKEWCDAQIPIYEVKL